MIVPLTSDIEELRQVLSRALGDERLAQVPLEQPLLASGLISSLELVGIVAALEDHYGLEIPPARATNENLATLSLIATLVGGRSTSYLVAPEPAHTGGALYRSFRRVLRRPLRAALLTCAALFLLDRAVDLAVRYPLRSRYTVFSEQGARLYRGLGELSHDDFRFAVREHEVSAPASAPRVLVFGDSGTIGSYLEAEEAFPAQAEARLRELGREVDVLNLAYYGRLLVKDLMLLELVWDTPRVEAVVFTVGDDTISRTLSDQWLERYRHISVNWELLSAFSQRIPSAERAPFEEQLQVLQESDRRSWGALRRFSFDHVALVHRAPFLLHTLTSDLLPTQLYSPLRRAEDSRARRYALEAGARRLIRHGIPPHDQDLRQLHVLGSVLRLLRQRGIRVVLFIEPAGPREWRQPLGGNVEAQPLLQQLADEHGAVLLDQKWALGASEFIDDFAHYTAEGNALLGRNLAEAIHRALESP